jgi:hypothetical protein
MRGDVQKLWLVIDIIFYLKVGFRCEFFRDLFSLGRNWFETVFVWHGFVQINLIFDEILSL